MVKLHHRLSIVLFIVLVCYHKTVARSLKGKGKGKGKGKHPEEEEIDLILTITNVSPKQVMGPFFFLIYSPPLVTSRRLHDVYSCRVRNDNLFTPGKPASEELSEYVAGNYQLLVEKYIGIEGVRPYFVESMIPTEDGNRTMTLRITVSSGQQLDFVGNLQPTNDAFVGGFNIKLIGKDDELGRRLIHEDDELGQWLGGTNILTFYAKAFDAGTRNNDQHCENVPLAEVYGVDCSQCLVDPDDVPGEGVVTTSSGIQAGIGCIDTSFNYAMDTAYLSVDYDVPECEEGERPVKVAHR